MSVNVGESVDFKVRTHSPRVPHRHLPHGLVRRRWRAADPVDAPVRAAAAGPAGLPHGKPAAGGLRQLEDIGVLAGAGRCGVGRATWRAWCGKTTSLNRGGPKGTTRVVGPDRRRRLPRRIRTARSASGKLEDAMKEKRASHIIFVVRDDAGQSTMLFQTADPTWVAFNRYGGSSLYGSYLPNAGGGGGGGGGRRRQSAHPRLYGQLQPAADNRQHVIQRAILQRRVPAGSLARAEWLRRQLLLRRRQRSARRRRSRSTRSSCRPATTRTGRRRSARTSRRARDAGVHLAFMGGGVEHVEGAVSAERRRRDKPYRTLVSYRETLADGKLDPDQGGLDRYLARLARLQSRKGRNRRTR